VQIVRLDAHSADRLDRLREARIEFCLRRPIRKLADDARAAGHDIGAVIGVVLGNHHQARPDEDRFLQIVTIS
jgi:hypothetical protein